VWQTPLTLGLPVLGSVARQVSPITQVGSKTGRFFFDFVALVSPFTQRPGVASPFLANAFPPLVGVLPRFLSAETRVAGFGPLFIETISPLGPPTSGSLFVVDSEGGGYP